MFRSRSVTAAPAISFGCWIGRCASSASPPSLPGGAGNRADYLAAPAIHAATTYVACRSRLPRARSYRIVVRGSACEAASWTSRSGTPASSAAVMKACHSVWGRDLLADPCKAGSGADDPPGAVPVQPPPVRGQEHRPFGTLADGQVNRPGRARCQRDGHHLAALTGHRQGPVATLEAQVLDVGAGSLRDPQPVQR